MIGLLHVLYWLRAEGTPRLAQALLREERRRGGPDGAIAILHEEPRDLRPELEAEGFAVHSLEYGHRWRYDSLYRRCVDLLRRLRPTGVVVYPLGPHLAVAAAARRVGLPVVLHLGNAPPRAHARQRRIMRAQLQLGEVLRIHYAACSDYVRDCAILAYDLAPSRLATVPNGVALDWFAAVRVERTPRPPGSPLRIGMIGSLEAHKDQDVLIDAIREVRARVPGSRLVLYGEGSRRPDLQARVALLELAGAVELAGATRDVRGALGTLDVFAYAVKDEEGLGIALVEALAAGVPVVTSSVGACLEVTAGGQLGRLVRGRDPATWAEALVAGSRDASCPLEPLRRYDLSSCLDGYLGLLDRDAAGTR